MEHQERENINKRLWGKWLDVQIGWQMEYIEVERDG